MTVLGRRAGGPRLTAAFLCHGLFLAASLPETTPGPAQLD